MSDSDSEDSYYHSFTRGAGNYSKRKRFPDPLVHVQLGNFIKAGDVESVRVMLEEDEGNKEGIEDINNAFLFAFQCYEKDSTAHGLEILDLFLTKGVNVNRRGVFADNAVKRARRSVQAKKEFKQHLCQLGYLHQAVSNNKTGLAPKLLEEFNADPNLGR